MHWDEPVARSTVIDPPVPFSSRIGRSLRNWLFFAGCEPVLLARREEPSKIRSHLQPSRPVTSRAGRSLSMPPSISLDSTPFSSRAGRSPRLIVRGDTPCSSVLLARREEPAHAALTVTAYYRSPRAQGGAPWLVPVIGSSQCAKFLLHRVWFHSECSPSQSPPLHRQ